MFDLSLQQLLVRFAASLLVIAVHGAAVAASAVALGDEGPKYDGRRTLSPLAHMDLLGTFGLVLFSLGWIRPIAVDPVELRSRSSLVLILGAGIGAVLALVVALRLAAPLAVTQLSGTAAVWTSGFLSACVSMGLWFVLFNLLPLPPLTGGLLALAAMPAARARAGKYAFHAKLVLGIFVISGVAARILAPVHRWVLQAVLNF